VSLRHWLCTAGAIVLVTVGAHGAAARPPAAHPLSGFVKYEHNKWMFHPCDAPAVRKGARRGYSLIDGSSGGQVFAAIRQRWLQSVDPLRGVYLEFDGYLENGRAAATRLHRALGWVDQCASRPNNVPDTATAWAAGNEPSWSFVHDGDTGYVQFAGRPRLELATLQRVERTGVQTFVADALRIEFSDQLCTDTMAEAAFGRSVVALVNGQLLEGCGFLR
jgi:uncharacterized membrane protein